MLYLINLMERLDLPDALEAACQLASLVGAWGTLELLGRSLLAPSDPGNWAHDPLWDALAALDGRLPGTLPGELFAARTPVRLPPTLAPAPRPERLTGPLLAGINPRLRRWLRRLAPSFRQHLIAALRLPPEEHGDLVGYLTVPGRLFVNTTYVDLVMELASVALPVRLSGLDANPGWVPRLGRVIRFHFRERL